MRAISNSCCPIGLNLQGAIHPSEFQPVQHYANSVFHWKINPVDQCLMTQFQTNNMLPTVSFMLLKVELSCWLGIF